MAKRSPTVEILEKATKMIKTVFFVTSEYTLTSNLRLSFSQANIMTQFQAVRFPFVPSRGFISADVKSTIFFLRIFLVFFFFV